MKKRIFTLFIIITMIGPQSLFCQVADDNNATLIASNTNTFSEQGTFTVPEGNDRLLLVFVSLGKQPGSSISLNSLSFNGIQITQKNSNYGANLQSHIYRLPLGDGPAITSDIIASIDFSGNTTAVIIGAASYHNVDQFGIGNAEETNSDWGGSINLTVGTPYENGIVVANVMAHGAAASTIVPTGVQQAEIFKSDLDMFTGEGCSQVDQPGPNILTWMFDSGTERVAIAVDIKVSPNDLCPFDPDKLSPGVCGCGIPDTDTDNDGTPDCIDQCPMDPLKIDPGFCGCGNMETGDSDNDGTADCNDQCPNDPTLIADVDSDGDGVLNCNENCPQDFYKLDPGLCGCGISDIDSDSDGLPDCNEDGNINIIAIDNIIEKGPAIIAYSKLNSGDSSILWSIGNRSETDSIFKIYQSQNNSINLASNNYVGLVLDSKGNFGVGRSPINNLLEVSGQVSKSSPGNWLANSDARLKTNINVLDPKEILARLMKLKGITYVWDDAITGVFRPGGSQYGFIAQDIQKVFPQLVTQDNNGFLETSYGTLDPIILEAMRAINSNLNILDDDVKVMNEKIDHLEARLRAFRKD